jgi:hypothetical protein
VTVSADGANKADSQTIAVAVGAFGGAGTGAIAEVTSDADVVASVGAAGSFGSTGAILVKALGDNDALSKSDAGTGGLIGVSGSAISAKVGGAVQALFDGDVTIAASVKVEAIGNNNADANALTIALGMFAGVGAGAYAEVTSQAVVEAVVGASAEINAPSATIDVLATGDNNAKAQANGGAGGFSLSIGVMLPTALIGGAVKAEFNGGVPSALALNVLAKGENTATATAVVASASATASAAGANSYAEITNQANVVARIGTPAPATITTTNAIVVDARLTGLKNKAFASTLGLAGAPFFSVSVMLAETRVGGGVSATMNGRILGASMVTVEASGGNLAETRTNSVSIGAAAGAGAGAIAEVTSFATVVASVGPAGSVTTAGELLVKAVGDNDAKVESNVGSGGALAIGASTLTAKVAGSVTASLQGAVTRAGSMKVEAIGNNNANAKALTITVALAGGIGANAYAEVTSAANVDALVGSTASVTVPSGQVDVLAKGENYAHAEANGGTAGLLLSIGVMLPTAYVSGSVTASFNGSLSARTLNVEADGKNHANAATVLVSVGIAAGAGTGSIAEVTRSATVVASVGSTASLATTLAMLVKAKGDNDALVKSNVGTGGIGAITGSTLDAKVGGSVQAILDGEVTRAASVKVEAIGDNNATAESLSIAVGLAAGAGADAYAEVTSDAKVEALVRSTPVEPVRKLTVDAKVEVLATGKNNATAIANGGGGGGISIQVMLPTAKIGGSVRAEFDGDLTGGALDVKALGENTATATASILSISLLGGDGAQANAEVTSSATTTARVGTDALIDVTDAVVVDARLQGLKNKARALAEGLSGGVLGSISIMGATTVVAGAVSASFAGEVVAADSLTVEANGGNLADADTSVVNFSALFTYAGAKTSATVETGADCARRG